MQQRSRTASQLALTVTVHVLAILMVTVIPVLVYEAVTSYAQNGRPRAGAFAFSGGVTYVVYAAHWLLKAKHFTFKFTSLHLITLVAFSLFVSGICDWYKLPTLQLLFPIGWSLLAGVVAAVGFARGQRFLVRACIVSLLISFPLALAISALLAYGQGMSSMAGMRW